MSINIEHILKERLYSYIVDNNPDLLIRLQEVRNVNEYLQNKLESISGMLEGLRDENCPDYLIEELCLWELTSDLRPSRYNYLLSILQDDFVTYYESFRESGILTYEVANLIDISQSVFDSFGFSESNEDDKLLRYAVTVAMQEYLESKSVNENVNDGLQYQSTIKS